jgi:3-hydroxyisobutyrate dehydrogenase
MTEVSLAGLGHMGIPIAERILAAGHPLTVWNRSPEKASALEQQGASVAERPEQLLERADVCVTIVADDRALEEVVLGEHGVLAGARPGTGVLIDMSTVSVDASRRVAEGAEARGVAYLRAPVSGNPGVVRAGNLTVIVSGPAAAFQQVEALLREIGPNVYLVGGAEEARVVKLALQVMIGGTAELMSEALVLGEAGGVDRATLLEVMGNSAVGSPFVKYKTAPLVADDYSPTFTTAMMQKDVALILEFAASRGVSLPVTSRLEDILRKTAESGYADTDLMALFLWLRSEAGLGEDAK